MRRFQLHVTIHVTRDAKGVKERQLNRRIKTRRPDIDGVFTMAKLENGGCGDVGFGVCGPKELVRQARNAAFRYSNQEGMFYVYWETFKF